MKSKIKYKKKFEQIERIDNLKINRRKLYRLDKNEGFYIYPEEFYIKIKETINDNFLSSYPQPYMFLQKLSENCV